jgi:hypothetical protein
VPTAPAFRRKIFSLCDNTVVSELARVIKHNVPGDALDMIVELDAVFHFRKKISEQLFSLDERLLADLGPAQLQQIESTQDTSLS